MSSSLLRLVYVSRAATAVDTQVLNAILSVSQERNETLGVTGVLCSGRGHFVQVLEGPESDVLNVYASILKDARHRDAALLSISLVSSRAFPTWSMGHIEGERLGPDLLERLIGQVSIERDTSASVRVLQAAITGMRKAR